MPATQPAASDVPHDVVRERPLINQLTGALRFILAFYEPGQRHLDTEAWKAAEAGGRAALARGEAALATPAPSNATAGFLATLTEDQRAQALSGDFDDGGIICGSTEEALRSENARLREALEFYADENRFGLPSEGPWGAGSTDFGNRARTALSALSR